MSFDEAIGYQRDFVAVKSRILAAMMPCDRDTSSAMQVVIAASQAGTNIGLLAKETGISVERIRCFGQRLRQAKIWKGNSADAGEWQDISYDRQRMTIILAQALVARGLLSRQWIGNAAIYSDQDGNVLARFCSVEACVDCLGLLLDLGSHGVQEPVSSKS